MLRKLSSIPEKRLALYGVVAGAALAAGVSPVDATPVPLDLTGLNVSTRTTPSGGSLYFDVNAASATAAVGFSMFTGADFQLNHLISGASANGLGGNAVVGATFLGPKAFPLTGSDFVGPSNPFIPNGSLAFFSLGTSGYLGLRFDITGSTHYGWANITLNNDYTVTLNALSYESDADTAIHVPAAVPDQGSSLALLAIGAAGLLAFRNRQRKTA